MLYLNLLKLPTGLYVYNLLYVLLKSPTLTISFYLTSPLTRLTSTFPTSRFLGPVPSLTPVM